MAIIESGKSKIEYINSDGLGVTRVNTRAINIPYTIENEIVEFELHEYRSLSHTILRSVIEKSNQRIEPICPYFGACGGCLLQHMSIELYNQFKLGLIAKSLKHHSLEVEIKPIISVPISSRRRCFLKSIKKSDKIFLGFNRFRSNQIINIDYCPILAPQLSDLISPLKVLLFQILEEKENSSIGITICTNGIDLFIESKTNLSKVKIGLLLEFAEKYLVRLQMISDDKTIKIFEQEAPYVMFGEHKIKIDTKSFLQATAESDHILSRIVNTHLQGSGKIVDLFCGLGTLSLSLKGNFFIDGFEISKEAIDILSSCKLPDTNFKTRNLYDSPLLAEELNPYKYAIMNPPRMGAKKQSIELTKSNIEKIIYVSCNPETFARDAKILCQKYKLLEVTPLDQFIYSSHIEVIGIFVCIP